MEQPAAETMAPAQPVLQPIEVVPPTPVAPPRPVQQAPQPEQPSVERKWKPIDFNAAMQQRLAEEAAARQRAIEAVSYTHLDVYKRQLGSLFLLLRLLPEYNHSTST